MLPSRDSRARKQWHDSADNSPSSACPAACPRNSVEPFPLLRFAWKAAADIEGQTIEDFASAADRL
jgi:hypothetical protein